LWGVEALLGVAFSCLSPWSGSPAKHSWRRKENDRARAGAYVKEIRTEYGLRFGVAAFLF
jgi:hypothetical protein